jgi:hypothetical protein
VCHIEALAGAEQSVALLAFQFTLATSKFEDIVSLLHFIFERLCMLLYDEATCFATIFPVERC